MEHSQLVELINTLNKEERAMLAAFAALPLSPKGKFHSQALHLLEICQTYYCADPPRPLSKEDVYRMVFPDRPMVEGKLDKVMVEAHKMVRNLLLVKHYMREANEFQQAFDFAEISSLRGLEGRQNLLIQQRLKRMLEEYPFQNLAHINRQFQLEFKIYEIECMHNRVKGDLNIFNVLHALEVQYRANRLTLLNNLSMQLKMVNIQVEEHLKPLVETHVNPEAYPIHLPLVDIRQTIQNILQKETPGPADARMLFDVLQEHENKFDREDLQEFYTYLRNICVMVLNDDPEIEEMYPLLFDLYKDNLARGFIHYNGKLHPSRIRAIMEYAFRVGQFAWAREFIEKHKNEIIGENETRDIYRMNLALYYFAIGNYEKCLDNIPHSSSFVDYQVASKRLEIKALYELESDLVFYKIDSFKMFLSRTSRKLISEAHQKSNLDFINMLMQIISSAPGDAKRAEKVYQRISAKKQAVERKWLLAKARRN